LSITEYDFVASQQNHLSTVKGVPLFQYDTMGDNVVGGLNGLLKGSEHQMKQGAISNDVNQNGGHSMVYFLNVISSLPQENYIFHNGQFIKEQVQNHLRRLDGDMLLFAIPRSLARHSKSRK